MIYDKYLSDTRYSIIMLILALLTESKESEYILPCDGDQPRDYYIGFSSDRA